MTVMSAQTTAKGWPAWAAEMAALYESHAASQFVLHGNVEDLLPMGGRPERSLAPLRSFLIESVMPGFEVVLSYDVGNGVRVERGGALLQEWPALRDAPDWPRSARGAVERLTHYFRYAANLARLGQARRQVGLVVWAAHLLAPAEAGSHPETGAVALLLREWAGEELTETLPLATCLVCENLHDLHPMVWGNPRVAVLRVPLPGVDEMTSVLRRASGGQAQAMRVFAGREAALAEGLRGMSFRAVERLLRRHEHRGEAIDEAAVAAVRKANVERECRDLIEFVAPTRDLGAVLGLDGVKAWLRQDLALWRDGDLEALPMGYLLCGPVGTGKTFLVECLAGEAGVPVVKIRNFRDRWVGSTESNLERIFRLLPALGRCYVFIDEADQALGRRDGSGQDSGVSGRVYAMMAKEMSNPANRGRVVWVLASSRPDLIEVDLKRPGRIDVRLPLFPCATRAEGWELLRGLAARRGLEVDEATGREIEAVVPEWLTPGTAEALAVKAYRLGRTRKLGAGEALREAVADHQAPVPREVLERQVRLAVGEATDLSLVPEAFRAFHEGGRGGGARAMVGSRGDP